MVMQVVEKHVSKGSATPHPKGSEPASSIPKNFWDPYMYPHSLTLSDQIRYGNTWGMACFQGVSHVPILTVRSHHHHRHHHLRLAPLRMHSTTSCQSRMVGSGPGRLRRSMTARGSRGRSAPSSSRLSAVVPVVSSNTQKARKSRSALCLNCCPFGRYARIGLG